MQILLVSSMILPSVLKEKISETLNALMNWPSSQMGHRMALNSWLINRSRTSPSEQDNIRVTPDTKFLGVTFDSNLSFIPHIRTIKLSCQKALDPPNTQTYRQRCEQNNFSSLHTLICSKLYYSSIMYRSASNRLHSEATWFNTPSRSLDCFPSF